MAQKEKRVDVAGHRALRLLIVEDTEADAELAVATLKQAGYAVSYDVVDTPESFAERLKHGDYDVILSDHNLCTWTGADVLEMLREARKDLPFVVMTAMLGDEAAVEYIKRGAADYILKDRLDRLAVAMGQVLRDRAHHEKEAQLQEQILCAKREWELTFDTVPDPVLLLGKDFIVQRANRAAAKALSLEFRELVGRPCYELLHSRHEPLPGCPHFQMTQTGVAQTAEIVEPRSGRVFSMSSTPLRDAPGDLRGSVLVLHDITERKQAEEKLRVNAKALESAANAVVITDREGRITWVNPAFTRLTGYAPEEVVGGNPRILKSGLHSRNMYQMMWETILAGRVWQGELTNRRKDGTHFIEEMTITPVVNTAGVITHFIAIQLDITERKQAEEALRRSEARYKEIVEGAIYGIYRSTAEGRFLDVNPALVEMLGYDSAEELLAANLTMDIYVEAERRAEILKLAEETDRLHGIEVDWKRKDGRPLKVRLSGRTVRSGEGDFEFEVIAEDITERRAMELQLAQAQKMQAIGQLAGGIAHDFNNLIGIIIGYADLLLDSAGSDEVVRRWMQQMKEAGERAASLTRQLLAFSRQQVLDPTVLDLNEVIAESESLLRRLLPENIELKFGREEPLGRIKGDRTQIEQVIMNLAVNARDAMPEGGRLVVETANVEFDAGYVQQHVPAHEGPHVMLAVSDTGLGMDAETQAHIFEPFYTTKERGKGTGLGLATVYGVVKQSEGFIWVYSEPQRGATFKVYFPRVEEEVTAAHQAPPGGENLDGRETILLVEDAEALRELQCEALRPHGYTLLEAENGAHALEIAARHAGPIHLVVSDMIMPVMSGRELAERLKEKRPEARVLFVSGYTGEGIKENGALEKGAAFLQKPFGPLDLLRKVRGVLDASPVTAS